MTKAQWLLVLAVGLFVGRRVSLGRGAEIAGISKPAFIEQLGKRRIPINYDLADFEKDLKTIAGLEARGVTCEIYSGRRLREFDQSNEQALRKFRTVKRRK